MDNFSHNSRDIDNNNEVIESVVKEEKVITEFPYFKGGNRYKLLVDGVCTSCAHCGQKLTDAVSVERGLGPVCSKRGYEEVQGASDEVQAMIDLAEYPELVKFLMSKWKPDGTRAVVNGLTKICSLNRRTPVHQACSDAIASLGYPRLASLLRESLVVVEIKECPEQPENFLVWVKKSEWQWSWSNSIRGISGSYASRELKGTVVPKTGKRELWGFLQRYYGGLYATVPKKDEVGYHSIKIPKVEKTKAA